MGCWDGQKEKWKEELLDIEEKMRDSRSKLQEYLIHQEIRDPSRSCTRGRRRVKMRRVGRGASAENSQSPNGSTSARWAQDVIGDIGGAGDFNSPRNGPKTRESSRSLRRQQR